MEKNWERSAKVFGHRQTIGDGPAYPIMQRPLNSSILGPEWPNTHQCTNVDGWCTDRILFSIPGLSLCHPRLTLFVCPFSALINVDLKFFLQLYFLTAPFPVFFFVFETFPTHPHTNPHYPPPTYSPIYLN